DPAELARRLRRRSRRRLDRRPQPGDPLAAAEVHRHGPHPRRGDREPDRHLGALPVARPLFRHRFPAGDLLSAAFRPNDDRAPRGARISATPAQRGRDMNLSGRIRHAGGPRRALAWTLLLSAGAAGCDGLLDVELPGSITEGSLYDPSQAAVLVTSAIADIECGFSDFIATNGSGAEETFVRVT